MPYLNKSLPIQSLGYSEFFRYGVNIVKSTNLKARFHAFTYAHITSALSQNAPWPLPSQQLFPEADSILTAFSMDCFCLFLDFLLMKLYIMNSSLPCFFHSTYFCFVHVVECIILCSFLLRCSFLSCEQAQFSYPFSY